MCKIVPVLDDGIDADTRSPEELEGKVGAIGAGFWQHDQDID
jgi:hypothetical protein